MVVWICLSCTISKVSAEQFRLSSCCKALHANKLISAVLQVLMFFCFLTLPRKEVCHHVQSEPLAFPNPMQMEATEHTFPTWKNRPPIWQSPSGNRPILGKSVTDFRKISRRLWENEPPTTGKGATDFGKMSHRLWENQRPTLGKWATDFGKMSHRLWENEPPTLGKWATDYGKRSHRLRENELRRRMEIRNKLFQKISLNKIS